MSYLHSKLNQYATVTYPLELKLNGDVIVQKTIVLKHNETWNGPFTFIPKKAGEDQKLEFLLYKNTFVINKHEKEDSGVPYRSLQLWVDVT